jgi:predicted transcriptional regulator
LARTAVRDLLSLFLATRHSFTLSEVEGSLATPLCYDVFMANTRSATLSIRLKSKTKRRLARLAEASGRSSNFLISDAVESYVADQERLLAEMRQADRQVKSGHYVRHEDMKAWLLSWGTDRELPPPKCVCGKVHADESPRPRPRG